MRDPYDQLKQAAQRNLKSRSVGECIHNLITASLNFLSTECKAINLVSRVTGKEYLAYSLRTSPNNLSRPVNRTLFNPDVNAVSSAWKAWTTGNQKTLGGPSFWYTMVTGYCAASDLFDRNNKKGPATYFELFVGHLFARSLGLNPKKQAHLKVSNRNVRLTMDFLFDLGKGKSSVHLPVKMSTRERVVQAWAHQRLLDAAFGEGKYKGILVVHSETKLDLETREVVEICVPDQWLAYQMLLSKMERIYYFDVPNRYAELARQFPSIKLKHFSDFFIEKDTLLTPQIP